MVSAARPYRVLIAHQSAIPHYRVAFYRAVQRLKPAWWSFAVVFDPDQEHARRLFGETAATESLDFTLEPTPTWTVPFTGGACYQPFLRRARHYDLLVLEDAFNNLAYPLAALLLGRRLPIAYWGHGRDVRAAGATGLKALLERRKLQSARAAAGFFAYTTGVRDFLVGQGVPARRVFALQNTIDIEDHRREWESLSPSRDEIRRRLKIEGRKALLYVGRIKRDKKLELLAAAVADLRRRDPSYHLLVGGGGDADLAESLRRELGPDGVTYLGVVDPADVGALFTASDAFVLPGRLGLAPLTALCYDLTPILIANPTHSPEVEYFDPSNSVIAPAGTDAAGYADAIHRLVGDHERWFALRRAAWPSIRHLTIDNMARNFIGGVEAIFSAHGKSGAEQ